MPSGSESNGTERQAFYEHFNLSEILHYILVTVSIRALSICFFLFSVVCMQEIIVFGGPILLVHQHQKRFCVDCRLCIKNIESPKSRFIFKNFKYVNVVCVYNRIFPVADRSTYMNWKCDQSRRVCVSVYIIHHIVHTCSAGGVS